MKKFIVTYLLLGFGLFLQAQDKLQVVTLNINETIAVSEGDKLFVVGERAGIKIESYEGTEIQMNLKLVSKNPSKTEAEQDLLKFKHLVEQFDNEIYFRNYIELAQGEAKPVSNLRAFYTIKIPKDIPIDIKNRFGATQLSSLEQDVNLEMEFSNLEMEDVNGEVTIQSKFGDIEGSNLRGNFSFITTRSDISLNQIEGRFKLRTKLGNIKIAADKSLYELNVDSDKSKIEFIPFKAESFKYDLSSSYGDLVINTFTNFTFLDNSKKLKHVVYNENSDFAMVTIKANFGSIKID